MCDAYLLWLGLLVLWQKLVRKGALESAAQTENAVVRLLWWETLDGGEDDFGLLWDQVIASVCVLMYALPILHPIPSSSIVWAHCFRWWVVSGSGAIIVPETQLSITSRIRIPVGNRGHPLRQRRLLDNVLCKGRLRHLCGYELRKGGEEGSLYSRASRGGFGCEAVVVD